MGNGFEVPYWENELERLAFVEVNTWGEDWQMEGPQGPEPYIGEYEIGVAGEAAWGQEPQEDPGYWDRARLHCLCYGSHVARGRGDCSGPCCPLYQDGKDVAGDEECNQP